MTCSACNEPIHPFEPVVTYGQTVYHLCCPYRKADPHGLHR